VKPKQKEVTYIGHKLTADGIKPDPAKVNAIGKMPTPEDVKSLQSYLGMANYLSKFLPKLAEIAEPLRELEHKGVAWSWNKRHESAYQTIKRMI